jgi:hypothetical protein
LSIIANTCIEVQTSAENHPSIPGWFAETVILSSYLASQGVLDLFEQQVLLPRKHGGTYEPLDFLAPLLGYAISGERSLADFFQRVAPFNEAFMALFGRDTLSHRSSLSRFLSAIDRPCLEAFRSLFHQFGLGAGWTSDSLGGFFDRQGRRLIVFDVDGTRQAARQRAVLSLPTHPPAHRRFDDVCAPGHKGRRRGEVVRTRTVVNQAHTHQHLGTYGNKGNGLYREELASALDVIAIYLKQFDLPIEMAVVRLDGLYGDFVVIAQLIEAGVRFLTRGNGYEILNYPNILEVLSYPPAARVTSKTGCTFEVFEGGWIPVMSEECMVRVILTRYLAPVSKKKPAVGKRIGPWVYEIYLTVLPEDGFAPGDIQDLYYGRGAFESMLAEEDIEEEADRWCSHCAPGQECWQIVCQWVWNLRLTLGKKMQQAPLRDIEWAPPTTTPAPLMRQPDTALEYGPWQVAEGPAGIPSPLFGARDFLWHEDGTLHCPAGLALRKTKIFHEDKILAQRVVYEARRTDCGACALREQCRTPHNTGRRGRTVTAIRYPLPAPLMEKPEQPPPVELGPLRWVDIAARAIRRQWIAHWQQQQVEILPIAGAQPRVPPPARSPRALRSHERWSWQERRARNAWHGPPRQRLKIGGVPTFLTRDEQ